MFAPLMMASIVLRVGELEIVVRVHAHFDFLGLTILHVFLHHEIDLLAVKRAEAVDDVDGLGL